MSKQDDNYFAVFMIGLLVGIFAITAAQLILGKDYSPIQKVDNETNHTMLIECKDGSTDWVKIPQCEKEQGK